MKEYGVFVICMVALCTLFSFLDLFGGQKKAARYAMGIISLCAICSALIPAISSAVYDDPFWQISSDEVSSEYEISDLSYKNAIQSALEEGIKSAVAEKFSLGRDLIKVELRGFSYNEMKADLVIVHLSGRAVMADFKGIALYIEENGFGKCEVRIFE